MVFVNPVPRRAVSKLRKRARNRLSKTGQVLPRPVGPGTEGDFGLGTTGRRNSVPIGVEAHPLSAATKQRREQTNHRFTGAIGQSVGSQQYAAVEAVGHFAGNQQQDGHSDVLTGSAGEVSYGELSVFVFFHWNNTATRTPPYPFRRGAALKYRPPTALRSGAGV